MDKFANLPTPLKWVVGVTGIGAIFGAGIIGAKWGWLLLLIFILVLLLLLLVFVGGYFLWNRWKGKKQDSALGKEIEGGGSPAPTGMSATDIARLDSLRKKFQDGVEAFRTRGKNLYTLPWYVIIGEPGSGKTEAVRHCNVGFPPGMHEGENDVGYMGTGGTINMNWWFTNYAVLLDTAGRLVFEQVKPGETNEWKEFLKLLRKFRPNCPINGLLLAIPSDSLIKDTADQIAAKAGKIAQQLDVIQRVLDFRFPVYVIVTKSDKINGFREFFENLTDPQLQHQMMGWSNPEPLDSAFKPESVDSHLSQVAERLRRRRLGLMRDPVPEHAPRRIDEVDSLFALPNSLLLVAPRLRKYLETIFMPGQWSSKPLFLRGIYFTSSMREGAALDQELAEAIGVPADELPEGKAWERDRAYFLKDLFMDKVFKEKGLITRATNTRAMLRRRQVLLYTACFVALAVFVVIAWLGMKAVRSQVGDRAAYWAAASAAWDGNNWNYPVIRPDETREDASYLLVTNRITFSKEIGKMTVGEFEWKLCNLAERDIQGRWTSPGLAHSYNSDSKKAQRVVFEDSVLLPVVEAAGKRMRTLGPDVPQPGQADALVALLRVESDIASGNKGGGPLEARTAAHFLGSLLRYDLGSNLDWSATTLDSNLVPAMMWTYNTNKAGRSAWPPRCLSTTTTNSEGVVTNEVLMAGLDYFIRHATNTIQLMTTNWPFVDGLSRAVGDFDTAEKAALAAIADNKDAAAVSALAQVVAARNKIDALARQDANLAIFAGGVSLTNAYFNFTNEVTSQAVGAFHTVAAENEKARQEHPKAQVFKDIEKRLDQEKNQIMGSLANIVPPGIWLDLAQKDACFLARVSGPPPYQQRGNIYQALAAMADPALVQGGTRAQLYTKFRDWADARQNLPKYLAEYDGCQKQAVSNATAPYLARANSSQAPAFLAAYRTATQAELREKIGFPIFRGSDKEMGAAALDAANLLLLEVSAQVADINDRKLPATPEWHDFANWVADLTRVGKVARGSDEKPNFCSLSLSGMEADAPSGDDAWRGALRVIRLDVAGADPVRTNTKTDTKMGTVPVRGAMAFQLSQREETGVYKTIPTPPWKVWGPLHVIAKGAGRLQPDGSWLAAMPLGDDRYSGKLRVRLTFDQPLPDTDHWPEN